MTFLTFLYVEEKPEQTFGTMRHGGVDLPAQVVLARTAVAKMAHGEERGPVVQPVQTLRFPCRSRAGSMTTIKTVGLHHDLF